MGARYMPAMFDFRPAADTPKPEAYRQLVDAAEALTAAVAKRVISSFDVCFMSIKNGTRGGKP